MSDSRTRLLEKVTLLRKEREASVRRRLNGLLLDDAPRPSHTRAEAEAIETAVHDTITSADKRN